MNYWQVFLMGLDERAYHPSINHAMTIMSSMSVLQRNHFKGKWPNATVSCGGMFLGNELLIKGDGVCLLPRAALSLGQATDIPPVTDVLVIKNIEVSLENCNDNLESNLLCEKTAVRVVGKAYTTNKERAWRAPGEDPSAEPTPLTNREVINAFQAVNMRDYGPWYRLHDDEAFCRVSPDLVLGRLYDYAYMKRMFGGTSMSYSMSGVVAGREYGRLTDARIPDGKEWFFGDTRFETLAVATSNGIEVGKFDNARDLKMLRACLHVIDGDATQQDYKDAKVLTRATYGMIGSSHDQETFESVGKISTMVSTALEPTVVPGEETPDLGPETKTDDKSSVGVEEDTVMEDAAQVVEGASLEQDENEKPVSLLSGPSSAGRCRKSFRSGTEHSELSRVSQASISKRRKMT
ncbi:hypothetical protein KEM55_002055 [Ascosphaera atra]|nr:hypothetical protein KEM55_002055 [Ascosphaera atra]